MTDTPIDPNKLAKALQENSWVRRPDETLLIEHAARLYLESQTSATGIEFECVNHPNLKNNDRQKDRQTALSWFNFIVETHKLAGKDGLFTGNIQTIRHSLAESTTPDTKAALDDALDLIQCIVLSFQDELAKHILPEIDRKYIPASEIIDFAYKNFDDTRLLDAMKLIPEMIRVLQSNAVPEGWKLVPLLATPAMDTAGYNALGDFDGAARYEAVYYAMIAAAPLPHGEK